MLARVERCLQLGLSRRHGPDGAGCLEGEQSPVRVPVRGRDNDRAGVEPLRTGPRGRVQHQLTGGQPVGDGVQVVTSLLRKLGLAAAMLLAPFAVTSLVSLT